MSASCTFALKMVDLRAMRVRMRRAAVSPIAPQARFASSDHRRRIDGLLHIARREARDAARLEPHAAADAEPEPRLQRRELVAWHLDVDVVAVVDAPELDPGLRADGEDLRERH